MKTTCVYLAKIGDWCAHSKIQGISKCKGRPSKVFCPYYTKTTQRPTAVLSAAALADRVLRSIE